MENIWTKIGGDNTSVKIYQITYDCNIFCMIKKIKITNFILIYKNNELLELKNIHNNSHYTLTYIPERSQNNYYLFLCKQIGGIDDLYLSLNFDIYDKAISCLFTSAKPCIVKKYTYNSYTRQYIETIHEQLYKPYEQSYIDKPKI